MHTSSFFCLSSVVAAPLCEIKILFLSFSVSNLAKTSHLLTSISSPPLFHQYLEEFVLKNQKQRKMCFLFPCFFIFALFNLIVLFIYICLIYSCCHIHLDIDIIIIIIICFLHRYVHVYVCISRAYHKLKLKVTKIIHF